MITLQKIQDAHKKILPYVNYTPLIHSNFLSKNSTVKLKLENFQITGSFKLRGAVNKLLALSEDDKSKGVIAVSTGNHGKDGAYASKVLGSQSTIYMSSIDPEYRKNAIKKLVTHVEIHGKNSDEADINYTQIAKATNHPV